MWGEKGGGFNEYVETSNCKGKRCAEMLAEEPKSGGNEEGGGSALETRPRKNGKLLKTGENRKITYEEEIPV